MVRCGANGSAEALRQTNWRRPGGVEPERLSRNRTARKNDRAGSLLRAIGVVVVVEEKVGQQAQGGQSG